MDLLIAGVVVLVIVAVALFAHWWAAARRKRENRFDDGQFPNWPILQLAGGAPNAAASGAGAPGGAGAHHWVGGGNPNWLKWDTQCPPPDPPRRDLTHFGPGRILGAPDAAVHYVRDVNACAALCSGPKCSGWAFARSRPNIVADGTYACQTFTLDDKNVILYPPATNGDYFSYTLTCAPRSGPTAASSPETAITDIVGEAAVVGRAPDRHVAAQSVDECLQACKNSQGCIGATFHGHDNTCTMYDSPHNLVLMTMPGGHHVTSASFFAGEYMIPIYPAPLPGTADRAPPAPGAT